MKNPVRLFSVIFIVALCFAMSVPALAAPDIVITRQPQNPTFPELSGAQYTVEAVGGDLTYTWFIIFDGVTYDTSKAFSDGETQPWQAGVLEAAGTYEGGKTFYIQGITEDINGAQIFCRISNGKTSVDSAPAYIAVAGSAMPPQINVPAAITVNIGTPVDLYCDAETVDDTAAEYLWYETDTGELYTLIAINRGAETEDTLHVDTDKVGTRYYACMVTTATGGRAYSSIIPVTVLEKPAVIETDPPATDPATDPETDPATTPETDPPATVAETDTSDTSKTTENTETAAPDTASPKTKSAGIKWWMITVPVAAFAIGGGSVLIFTKSKTKK